MILSQLSIVDFRNYLSRDLDFTPGINVVWGKNASGKTNLLEAIYLLSTGESFRAKMIDEMVGFGKEMGRVNGRLFQDEEKREIEVLVTKGLVGGQKTLKRKYFMDGAAKRKSDFVGQFPVVIFRPEDMDMLTGTPDGRRNFMDMALNQVSETYKRSLATYTQALRRRNKLLDVIREGLATRYALTFWDGLLIKHGNILSEERGRLVDFINDLWGRSELFNNLKLEYDRSIVSEARLLQYTDEELAVGHTLVGPHKDDFSVFQEKNLGIYGSRGEQRMAVLALKLGEIYFIEEKLVNKPLLLLDDIFSELDEVHKREVLRVMSGRQVVVTTAVKADINLFDKANVIGLGD